MSSYSRLKAKVIFLEDRVLWLEKALEPFTDDELCTAYGGNVEGDESIIFARNGAKLTLGHFRNARRLIKEKE